MNLRNLNVEEAILRFEPANQGHALTNPVGQDIDRGLVKDLIQDHINSLQKINLKLGASVEIAEKLGELKAAYDAIFGAPIADSVELTEAYQDRVQQVANAVEQRSKATPFTKEELLGAIDWEAKLQGIAEYKFKDTPRSTAWKDFVKDVLAALKGKVKFSRPGVAASAAARKAETDKKLQTIAGIIEDSVGYSFPDGDPIDYIVPRVRRLGINTYDVHDWLDRAAKKHLHATSLNDYLGAIWDDYAADHFDSIMTSGAGLINPYTNKLIKLSARALDYMFAAEPFYVIDILSARDIFSVPDLKSILNKHKDSVLKSILSEIKKHPNSYKAKVAVRNLVGFGIDWPELAKIQKSIDPAMIAEHTMKPGDVFAIESYDQAIVGTVLSVDNDTIIIEGDTYAFTKQESEQILKEAEYQGRKVQLGKPMAGDVKKFKVFVRDPKTGNIKKVNFGDKGMEIKRDDPERRKSFRARHGCGTPRASDRTKAAYWSCRMWSSKPVSKILKGK